MASGDDAARPEVLPAEAVARFVAAEARLYPTALSDPAMFQRATSLVGLVVEELRASCEAVSAVLDRRDGLMAELPALAAGAGFDPRGLSVAAVVDAACALRCRELGGVERRTTWRP